MLDMRTQFAFHHRIQKGKDFAFDAANLKLNAAVVQISDPSDDIESFRDLPDHPAKADALDLAFVKNLK